MNDPAQAPLPSALPEPEAFAALMAEYDRAIEHMSRSHELLNAQVSALHQEIEQKNRLLERKERLAALGEMAAGVAHEIRNPLGGISLYLELLANDVAEMAGATAICAKIRAAVDRLNLTVEAILGFTRQLDPQIEAVDVSRLFDEVVGLAARDIEAHELRISMEIAENARSLSADHRLLHQLLLNLLRNACEASPHGGRVRMVARLGAAGAELSVSDQGAGIDAAAQGKLFTPFFTTKKGGTGLGLAFCQRIAEAHAGALSVENIAGGGAVFTLRLPAPSQS